MISLPITPETEQMLLKLSRSEKKTLALIINSFVARPKRTMPQVMDSMTEYARKQGLDLSKLDDLLKGE
jgi:hypothetical protein